MKNFFTYPVFLVLFLSFIGAMGFGALLRHAYICEISYCEDGGRSQYLQKTAIFFAEIPKNVRDMIKYRTINLDKFPRINVDHSPRRFRYDHPIVLDDGSLISFSENQPIFKIDFCSKLKWINDEEKFHHGQNLDRNGDIWTIATIDPQSRYVSRYNYDEYEDDAIVKIDANGNVLYKKSVTEILIENDVVPETFVLNNFISGQNDPIHLNDIEPAFQDTEYWKKDDLFLSIRDQNAIVHYRPSANKVLNVITGPFVGQHDADIISDKEISIFNNNQFIKDNKYSEVLVYNFETKTFNNGTNTLARFI